MKTRREIDTSRTIDYSALGHAIVFESKRICHEKHWAGVFDPSPQECLRREQEIVMKRMSEERSQNLKGGRYSGTGKSKRP
jgi:hypothetical protein